MAVCNVARRLTFAWASGKHEDSAESISALRPSLQYQVLSMVPMPIVLKHASVEMQRIALKGSLVVSELGGSSARLNSNSCWSASPRVLFGELSDALSLNVSVQPVAGVDWDCQESRWRHEWMQHIAGVLALLLLLCVACRGEVYLAKMEYDSCDCTSCSLWSAGLSSLTHLAFRMPLSALSDLSNLLRSLMQLTSLQALELDCSGSKLQDLPQPMHATLLPAFPNLTSLSLKCIRLPLLGYNCTQQLAHDLCMLTALSSLHFLTDTIDLSTVVPLLLCLTGEEDPASSKQLASSLNTATLNSAAPIPLCSTLHSLTLHGSRPPANRSLPSHAQPHLPPPLLQYFSNLQSLAVDCRSPVPLMVSAAGGGNGVATAGVVNAGPYLPASLRHLTLLGSLEAPGELPRLYLSRLATRTAALDASLAPTLTSLRSLEFCLPLDFWHVRIPNVASSFQALSELSDLEALSIDVARVQNRKLLSQKLTQACGNRAPYLRGVLCAAVAALRSLTSLRLSVCSLDCPAASAALQQLSQLQELHLNDSCWRQLLPRCRPITARGGKAGTARRMGDVPSIHGGFIGAQHLEDLVRADDVSMLYCECYSGSGIPGATADTLVHLTKLTSLHAFAPRLGVTAALGPTFGFTVSSALAGLTGLRELWLECSCVSSTDTVELVGALRWLVQLTDMSLMRMCLFEATEVGVGMPGVRNEAPSGALGNEVAVVLAHSLQRLTRLKALRLDGNDMSRDKKIAEHVCGGISGASGLTVLSLRNTGVTEEQVHALRLKYIPPKAVVFLKEQR